MDIKTLTNYLHNKYKGEGKYISKRVIEECVREGVKLIEETNSAFNSPNSSITNQEQISRIPATSGDVGNPTLDTIQSKHKAEIDKDYDK